ncbi:hypothetical protein M5X11_23940 [Paenibacillus alginolyticus]|uniref:hypothetical protein n=1 Tax=Paenibacillus alginolyticus TaxID=59839 RepID=UPI00040C89BF|nr:hypothetical protein [Paenibacillus alginolyticus]MCY9667936.1 hypothetical protein [Paenibacillus alginolyticus]
MVSLQSKKFREFIEKYNNGTMTKDDAMNFKAAMVEAAEKVGGPPVVRKQSRFFKFFSFLKFRHF